jgi:similar to stage IV sporulation protein
VRAGYWITEGIRLRLSGPEALGCLNELARRNGAFARVRTEPEGGYTLTVRRDSLPLVLELARSRGAEAEVLGRRGLWTLLRRLRAHALPLILPMLLLTVLLWSSDRIWELEVTGNRTLSRAEILDALEDLGVGVGHHSRDIDNEMLRSAMQEKLGKLIYLTVRARGSRALVIVRERRDPPPSMDPAGIGDVTAARTGLITRMSVLQGKGEAKPGDTVLEGQLLISGSLTDLQGEGRKVRALGDIWARTWYEASAAIPLEHEEKSPTGRSRRKWAVKVCNFRLNLCFDSGISYEAYDKMQTETRLRFLGAYLPVSTVCTEYREYKAVRRSLSRETGEELLRQRLRLWLADVSGCREPESCSFRSEERNGILYVTMTAECLEQIGVSRPLPD